MEEGGKRDGGREGKGMEGGREKGWREKGWRERGWREGGKGDGEREGKREGEREGRGMEGGRDKGVRDGGRDMGVRDGGWNHPRHVGLLSCSAFHVLIVPPFHALVVPSFCRCRGTSLSRVGICSCLFCGVRVVWAVGFVSNGHRVEVGVGMAVVVGVYNNEQEDNKDLNVSGISSYCCL